MSAVVDTLTTSLAKDMLPGEQEKSMQTASFAMTVQADYPGSFYGRIIGNGKVSVPLNALPQASGSTVSAKVTSWAGAGPLVCKC